jgi:hypothetical protein
MHGGQIGVEHLEGIGSISRFTLPALASNRPAAVGLPAALAAVAN